ncbi:hypothetical protein ACIBG7_32755 [Nonomuraea sp. NPDC050328]|uniref:hypothetical protein n=1 Tax=Nonomuraea sp. NPDC050328 TaxID=3364361 RepID=UPI00379E0B82
MTYQLAALRFRTVGERSARFIDLPLDFTAPVDGGAVPQDSVVWLRNGGGKSSILSLTYALLLPHANDFMGKSVQRSLTDYVDSGDTSHVIATWHPHDAGRTLLGDPEEVLVTGVVHEWADLRRPAKAADSKEKLSSCFYAFHAVPGVLDSQTLPFCDEAGRPRRLAGFLEELRELAKAHGRHPNLVITDKQHVWTQALLDRHLDPEIFRTQKQMNHVEGGVEDLFKFPAAKDFINFLLDLATQPEAATSVATRLASVTELLAAKPRKIEEREFCVATADELSEVAAGYERVQAATDEQIAMTTAAETLAASFAAAIATADELKESLRRQLVAFGEARTAANNDRSAANDLVYLYRREGAKLRLAEAEAQEQKTEQRVGSGRALVQAWETTILLAAYTDLQSRLAQAELLAAAEEAEIAPLRDEHARHAAVLRHRLTMLADEADFAADLAEEQEGTARELWASCEEAAERAREELSKATTDETQAQTQLDILDQRRQEGVERGHLPGPTVSPEDHLVSVIDAQAEITQQLENLATRCNDRRARRTNIAERETTLAGERSAADAARTVAGERQAELTARWSELTGSERLRGLAEVAEDEAIDVWAEGPLLLRRLSDAVIAADDERILRRAEQHADRRTIEAQERNQVLPSSLDAERIERELLDAGVPAQTGWAHLRSVIPAQRLASALDLPEIARLGSGVVVPTARIADAIKVLDSHAIETTSLVGVYSAEAADAVVRGGTVADPMTAAAWMRLQPGLVDQAEAEAAVRLLKERAHAHTRKEQELTRQRAADDELRRTVSRFLDDCPAGHLTMLSEEIERLDRRLQSIDDEQKRNKAELEGLDGADRLDDTRREVLNSNLRQAETTITWLRDFALAVADAAGWHHQVSDARARAAKADQDFRQHQADARQALLDAQQRANTARSERDRALGYRSERDSLPEESIDHLGADEDRATPLETLRGRRLDALKALESRAAQSVLADRVQSLSQQVAQAKSELLQRPADDRATAEHLLASPEGQEPLLRSAALAQARQGVEQAVGEWGAAKNQVKQCREDLKEIEQLYRQPPRRTLPVVPDTSEEAEALAAEQELRSHKAKERVTEAEGLIGAVEQQTSQADHRMTLLGTLLEALPDPGVRFAEPFADDEDAARARSKQVREAMSAASKIRTAAEAQLTASVDRLRRTAARFPGISGPMKDRVANDSPPLLGPHAGDLRDKLRLRAQTLAGELGAIAQDQAILSEALAQLVKDSFDMLGKAERASHMKTGSGSWADKKVLRISFDRPSDADLVVYAERVIDRLVEKGLKPEGMPLLKAAVHEAAGPRGFTVKVLKPTDDTSGTTEDISRLAKWSGGEKLTVCVALYCTLAALRAAHTGRKGRSGGVLLLDNPIGRASSSSLVRLQRDVAASHGVQLIYTTGVKDPAAVIQFPNVIRLDNREGRGQSRRYIVPEASVVTGIRVAHADHP